MTSWYKAVCDQHREVCTVFCIHQGSQKIVWPIDDERGDNAQAFLSDHWACELRLLRDDVGSWPSDYKDRTLP